jgi:hypothetical protein
MEPIPQKNNSTPIAADTCLISTNDILTDVKSTKQLPEKSPNTTA